MNMTEIPVISAVSEAGADDRVFDVLLLLGPLVIGLIVIFKQSLVTEVLAVAYISTFVTYVLHRGIQE
jgi:uncharacterized membrane protein YuzA (DUF378 family)